MSMKRGAAAPGPIAAAALAALLLALPPLALSCAHERAAIKGSVADQRGPGGPGGAGPGGEPPGPPPDGSAPPGMPSGGASGGQGGPPSSAPGGAPGGAGPGAPGGQASAPTRIAAAYSLVGASAELSGKTFKATAKDSSAVYVGKGATLELSDSKLLKSGASSNEDASGFYGVNAAFLAAAGGRATLAGLDIETEGGGANAVVATGSGTSIAAKGLRIRTSADSSRGLHATMRGRIEAEDVDIATKGAHCAAVATDRGEGTVIVKGGTLATAGADSPGVYSTGDIRVTGATIAASRSEAAVVEGRNSIRLVDCAASGARKCGVMLYQSFSGDAASGISSFAMEGGSLEAAEGPLFYVTNTKATVSISGAKASAASGVLVKAGSDRWGRSGSNGGALAFTAKRQALSGDVLVEPGSSVSLGLEEGSALSGRIEGASLAIGEGCTWTVAGDSRLAALTLAGAEGEGRAAALASRIADGGHRVTYDASLPANSWLGGEAYALAGGGKLEPAR